MNIYIYKNNQQEGPYNVDEVKNMVALGTLKSEDLAWHEGISDWLMLKTFKEVFPSEPPPPPTPKNLEANHPIDQGTNEYTENPSSKLNQSGGINNLQATRFATAKGNAPKGWFRVMFGNLFNYSIKRNKIEAFGFYVTYTFGIMLLAVIIPSIFPNLFNSSAHPQTYGEGYDIGVQQGMRIAAISCAILSQIVIASKGLNRWSFKYISITLLSSILGFVGGALLGVIPIAWMTTKPTLKTT
jgi:hypothetical protein